jgi:hypothetical protein
MFQQTVKVLNEAEGAIHSQICNLATEASINNTPFIARLPHHYQVDFEVLFKRFASPESLPLRLWSIESRIKPSGCSSPTRPKNLGLFLHELYRSLKFR